MKRDLDFFQKWLDNYTNFERAPDARLFRLETTERLAGLFGHPELTYKTYHVAGSKGKGSLSKMLACILQEMDTAKPVGVYASPHVYYFRERFSLASGFCEEDVYNKTVSEFAKTIDALPDSKTCASWFELNTAFAFLLFKNAGVGSAVFEVGMGGRLDATNIIKPEISCITEIELEHTAFLGDTLEKIAGEKAGIIKEKVPVVVAAQKDKAVREVFRKVAAEKNAPLYFVDELAHVEDLHYEGGRLIFRIVGGTFERPLTIKLKMLGKVQAANALQAALAMKILYPELKEDVIERGLEKANLPGRFELRDNLVLDGSHTVESIAACVETFKEVHPEGPRILLFGAAADKDVEAIAPLFKGVFDKVFITRPGDFKKSNLGLAEQAFADAGIEAVVDDDYRAVIKSALEDAGALTGGADNPAALLATGSFYLIDEVDKVLEEDSL